MAVIRGILPVSPSSLLIYNDILETPVWRTVLRAFPRLPDLETKFQVKSAAARALIL